jgi:hypothetical protein
MPEVHSKQRTRSTRLNSNHPVAVLRLSSHCGTQDKHWAPVECGCAAAPRAASASSAAKPAAVQAVWGPGTPGAHWYRRPAAMEEWLCHVYYTRAQDSCRCIRQWQRRGVGSAEARPACNPGAGAGAGRGAVAKEQQQQAVPSPEAPPPAAKRKRCAQPSRQQQRPQQHLAGEVPCGRRDWLLPRWRR